MTTEVQKMEGALHGAVGALIGYYLVSHVLPNHLGHVFGPRTVYALEDDQTQLQPDVSFVALARWPKLLDTEITVVPDLAVEIVSKNDLAYEIATKIRQYQAAGVKLIWVIYPVERTVAVYRLADGLKNQTLLVSDTLDGADVLPGFILPLQQLFR